MLDRLRDIKHLALDLDGTLYLGGRLFPFTLEFLKRVKAMGIGRTFFTNNSSVATSGYVEKLRRLGIETNIEELYSSTTATLDYLRASRPELRRLFVLGTPALRQEFAENGFALHEATGERDADGGEPDGVVVGFDTTLDYKRLCRAAWWISRGKPFLATHPDAVCPTDEPTLLPDCGAICKLLAHATGVEPEAVLGKPSPAMLYGAAARVGVAARDIAVVGDRLYTDVALAQAAGAVSVLVLSGETTRERAGAAERPADFVLENVMELAELLAAARGGSR
ncbi:MAG: hydrolase [Phycisphaerales bacterium]|nr:hydrolase [Phycisphaerales bacterium]